MADHTAPPCSVQVVRLPTVRSRIAAWRQAQGLPPLPPLDPPPAVLQEAGAEVPGIMAGLRCGDVYQRGLAAGEFNDLLIAWGRNLPLTPARQQVMEVRRRRLRSSPVGACAWLCSCTSLLWCCMAGCRIL